MTRIITLRKAVVLSRVNLSTSLAFLPRKTLVESMHACILLCSTFYLLPSLLIGILKKATLNEVKDDKGASFIIHHIAFLFPPFSEELNKILRYTR